MPAEYDTPEIPRKLGMTIVLRPAILTEHHWLSREVIRRGQL